MELENLHFVANASHTGWIQNGVVTMLKKQQQKYIHHELGSMIRMLITYITNHNLLMVTDFCVGNIFQLTLIMIVLQGTGQLPGTIHVF